MFRRLFFINSHKYVRYRHDWSYYSASSNQPLLPMIVPDLLERNARECPEKYAIISQHQGLSKTFKELQQDVNKFSAVLKSLGCSKGDRIAIWAPNCYEWVVTFFAVAKLGSILVNINPAYRGKELEYSLNFVDCHTLVASQRLKILNYYEFLQNLIPSLATIKSTQHMDLQEIPSLKNIIMLSHSEEPAPHNFLRYDDLIKSSPQIEKDFDANIQFDDAFNIQFTSGTTGKPKGAALTHHNLMNNARFMSQRMYEDMNDSTICLQVPLFHAYGCVGGLISGGFAKSTVVFPNQLFNPVDSLKAIHNYKCSFIFGTPTMYVDLLNSPEPISKFKTDSLTRGTVGGAPCPPELLKELQKAIPSFKYLLNPYGTTELSPVATCTSIRDSENYRLSSVGKPLEHTEIKIIDHKTGEIKPIGEPGEILVRGYCTFPGYWKDVEKTKEALDSNRWYHTGDVGTLDKDGYLYISGRIKDMIIRGGENIYPQEIEDILVTNPLIAEAYVVGIPDKRMGEEMCAFVRLKSDISEKVSSDNIKAFCKDKISHFKIPRYIEFTDDLPRTATGKVQKFVLKDIAIKKFG